MTRIIFDIILLISVLIAPWWSVTAVLAIGLFVFPYFFEAVLIAFLIDVLYGAHLLSIPLPWVTLAVFTALIASILLKGRFRFSGGVNL